MNKAIDKIGAKEHNRTMSGAIFRYIAAAFLVVGIFLSSYTMTRAAEKIPVILDTDMVDFFDDGVALMMLAKNDGVQLLGVTTVFGNNWEENCTASALRQLECIGRTDIPVYRGLNEPRRSSRFAAMENERKIFGAGTDIYNGLIDIKRPTSWQTAYKLNYEKEPQTSPAKESAVDFLIKSVRERPHEITIVAIGSAANIAAAVNKDPQFAANVKRIVYMGGTISAVGDATPAAEFNFWIDPESAKIALRAPFPEQIIFPLDVCKKIIYDYKTFSAFESRIKSADLKKMWDNQWYVNDFREKKDQYHTYFWDVFTAAFVIDSSVVTKEYTCFVDVNDVYSPSYGQLLAYKINPPEGTQKARIVTQADAKKIKAMLKNLFNEL